MNRYDVISFLILGSLIIAAGYFLNFEFAALSIALLVPGRQIGWYLSRHILYPARMLITGVVVAFWGIAVAVGIYEAIHCFQPSLIVKIIFGYGARAYVSIPNFGLFKTEDFSEPIKRRHSMIENIPLVAYITTSIFMAWLL